MILQASALISIANVSVGWIVSNNKWRNTRKLIMRDKKVEIIPDPGPISKIKNGFCCKRKEYSFSRESRNKKESWSGSYLFIIKQIIHTFYHILQRKCEINQD